MYFQKILLQIKATFVLLILLTTAINAQDKMPKFKMPQFGKGISFMTKDSTFKVEFHARIQSLLEVSYDVGVNEVSSSFSIRRARLKFDGYAFSPKIVYKIELGLSSSDISTNREDGQGSDASRIILDAVVKWNFFKSYELWIGQTKLQGNRDRVVSSANMQLVDRSLLNSRFNLDRDMGVQLHAKYKFGNVILKPSIAFTQGEGRDITADNFGGFCYTGHLDFLPLGEFTNKGDYTSADLEREETPKLAIGLTANYNDRSIRQSGQLGNFVKDSTGSYVENSLSSYMADMIFKYKGLSLLSEFAYTVSGKLIDDVSKKFNTGYGFNVQLGYLFPKNYELVGRYTMIRKDNAYSGLKNENEYTLAFSKYIVGPSLKIQTDLSYTHAPTVLDGVFRIRLQVEMQF